MLPSTGQSRFAGVRFWALWDFSRTPWYTLLEFVEVKSMHGVNIYSFSQYAAPKAQRISITEQGLMSGVVRPFCLSLEALDILSITDDKEDPHANV